MIQLCKDCGIRPAAKDKIYCSDCLEEAPLESPGVLNRVVSVDAFCRMEERLATLEQIVSNWTGGK